MYKKFRVLVNTFLVTVLPTSIIKKITTCDDIAKRVSDPENQTFWQKLDTRFHLFICPPCWDYNKDVKLINKECKNSFIENREKINSQKVENLTKSIIEKHTTK
jgi:hypothetical protein